MKEPTYLSHIHGYFHSVRDQGSNDFSLTLDMPKIVELAIIILTKFVSTNSYSHSY